MQRSIPDNFKPILWSYDVDHMDPEVNQKTIIVQAINYGMLVHWRWLRQQYGLDGVRRVLQRVPAAELRPRARRLASLVFDIDEFNYARRGAH